MERFILSCDSEGVQKINLPNNWIIMADSLGDRFYQSKYKENFILLNYRICEEMLNEFEKNEYKHYI